MHCFSCIIRTSYYSRPFVIGTVVVISSNKVGMSDLQMYPKRMNDISIDIFLEMDRLFLTLVSVQKWLSHSCYSTTEVNDVFLNV